MAMLDGPGDGSTQPTINVTPKVVSDGVTITVTVNDGGGGSEEVATTFKRYWDNRSMMTSWPIAISG